MSARERPDDYWFARHAKSIIFLIGILSVIGAWVALSLPVAVFPTTNFPRIVIGVPSEILSKPARLSAAEFERMVQLAPDEPISHYNLGYLYKLVEKPAQALAEFVVSVAAETRCERFHLLGTSGTVTTIAGIHLGLPRYDRRRRAGPAHHRPGHVAGAQVGQFRRAGLLRRRAAADAVGRPAWPTGTATETPTHPFRARIRGGRRGSRLRLNLRLLPLRRYGRRSRCRGRASG